jgi:dolichol-phosphate mannosyltransferase
MSYSVILPTLNEAGHIADLIKKINSIFLEINEKFEIIVVDDSSSDGTDKLCNDMIEEFENLKFFSRKGLKKNLANSINLGIQKSIYENIIWMDADFQHPPDFLKLFHKYHDKYDVLIFSRFLKDSVRYFENEKFTKEMNENQSVFFNKLCNFFLYKDITDYTSGYICVKKKFWIIIN